MGILFQTRKSSTWRDTELTEWNVFLHLFGRATVVNTSNYLSEKTNIANVFVTKGEIVYTNSVVTDLHCYSLHKHARELRKENRAPITELHQTLYNNCRMSRSLADLVVSYCGDIPNRVALPLSITECAERLHLILNDTEYFSGSRADEIRKLLKEKVLSPELLLDLKKIAADAQPQGFLYKLFDYDDRTEHEKIIFALFMEIKDFSDLQGLSRFDELQDDWYQFHNWPLRSVWKC